MQSPAPPKSPGLKKSQKDQIRELAEQDFVYFMKLVNPHRQYGMIHDEMGYFLMQVGDQLVLLPRAHQKSHVIATWVAWWITKHPETTILYVSATEDVAIAQLSAIKGILTSDTYRRYWPEMVNAEEAKRNKWAMMDIQVDHPRRREEGVRDHTVSARSINANTTGLHGDVIVFDDIVSPINAYTEEGREKVRAGYAQFASIMNPGGFQKVVGTRYHGKDVYGLMIEMEQEVLSDEGEVLDTVRSYTVLEKAVEEDGIFLWPRTMHPTSRKWFGFNVHELAKTKAKYFGAGQRAQFYAQYYNNPDDPANKETVSDGFQYYDPRHLKYISGDWYFKDRPLRLFAGGDLAYTDTTKSDYTAFAVVGVDPDGFIYVLDLVQFRTDKYSVYYDAVKRLHEKWKFLNLRIEAQTGGANIIVKYIQDQARADGRALVVEGKSAVGEKMERTAAILAPRYETKTIWHYRGDFMSIYEEQMMLTRPKHDDLRDAVAIAVEISRPASKRKQSTRGGGNVVPLNNRFGGYRV